MYRNFLQAASIQQIFLILVSQTSLSVKETQSQDLGTHGSPLMIISLVSLKMSVCLPPALQLNLPYIISHGHRIL